MPSGLVSIISTLTFRASVAGSKIPYDYDAQFRFRISDRRTDSDLLNLRMRFMQFLETDLTAFIREFDFYWLFPALRFLAWQLNPPWIVPTGLSNSA